MGEQIELVALDGFKLGAYRATPKGRVKGGLVVIQEIFGVNAHVREVADGYAKEGYLCIAPAVYDRVEKGVETGYTEPDFAKARDVRAAACEKGWHFPLMDVAAAVKALGGGAERKVGVVGYCWGGSLTWLSNARVPGVAATVSYYGGQIIQFNDDEAMVPGMMHFAEKDASIPMTDVEAIKAAHPELIYHVYPGVEHGFNCDHRRHYNADAAATARERTLAFFAEHVG